MGAGTGEGRHRLMVIMCGHYGKINLRMARQGQEDTPRDSAEVVSSSPAGRAGRL